MRHRGYYKNSRSARTGFGMLLLLIGSLLLLRKAGFYMPGWLISWPMFFVAVGLLTGIRHNFRNPVSYIFLLIGGIFLLDRMIPGLNVSMFVWPVALIAVGLFLILGRNYKGRCRARADEFEWDKRQPEFTETVPLNSPDPAKNPDEDFINATSVFGGVKKNIVSKNFRGGDIVNFMGGAEINLSQADIRDRVTLEVTQVFGGTKIIVPPHWEIHPEMSAIFGGIEDKRSVQTNTNPEKTLVIRGTSIFGGIDIRSF